MPERICRLVKAACVLLATFLVFEVARVIVGAKPLAHLSIPEVPALPAESTNSAPGAGTNRPPGGTMNGVGSASVSSTNGTNLRSSTNPPQPPVPGLTNTEVTKNTNQLSESNLPMVATVSFSNISTNISIALATNAGTNALATTNLLGASNLSAAGTNSLAGTRSGRGGSPRAGMEMAMTGRMGGPGQAVKLPPEVEWRVDKIVSSEIFGTVPHPMPTALQGIAGNSALVRSTTGQNGWVKEGAELGGLKLLRIGTNRVLVEENGEKKELMIYGGAGGESLMPKSEIHDEKKP